MPMVLAGKKPSYPIALKNWPLFTFKKLPVYLNPQKKLPVNLDPKLTFLSKFSTSRWRICVLVHCIWWISIRQQQSAVTFEFSLKIVARHFFWGLNRFCAIVSPCLTFCQTRWISHNPILEILLQEMSPHFIFFWRDDILDKLIRGDT